ncbi:hypothetical protein [Georgenia yuyongxinii]
MPKPTASPRRRARNLKFHEVTGKRLRENVQAFLGHIEMRGDPIFWG